MCYVQTQRPQNEGSDQMQNLMYLPLSVFSTFFTTEAMPGMQRDKWQCRTSRENQQSLILKKQTVQGEARVKNPLISWINSTVLGSGRATVVPLLPWNCFKVILLWDFWQTFVALWRFFASKYSHKKYIYIYIFPFSIFFCYFMVIVSFFV